MAALLSGIAFSLREDRPIMVNESLTRANRRVHFSVEQRNFQSFLKPALQHASVRRGSKAGPAVSDQTRFRINSAALAVRRSIAIAISALVLASQAQAGVLQLLR
jgi:hypothetical protein